MTAPTRGMWHRMVAVALGVFAGVVAAAGTLAVATAGFTLSYDAIRKVGVAAGVRLDWAWLLPMSVDGAMLVASVTAVVLKRMGRSTWYPWTVVLAGSGISISCNAVHATMREHIQLDDRTAMAVSAIPAVMLALSVHLLVVLITEAAQALGQSPTPTEQVGEQINLSARTGTEQANRSSEQGLGPELFRRVDGHQAELPAAPTQGDPDMAADRAVASTDTADGQRTDAQVFGDHGEQLFAILRGGGRLSRYRVELICNVSARQAERVRAVIEDLYASTRTDRTGDEQRSQS